MADEESETNEQEEQELDLIYMARTLREALRLERILEEAGVEYQVETGTYTAGFLMKRELAGAFFYVPANNLLRARQVLREKNYKPYLTAEKAE